MEGRGEVRREVCQWEKGFLTGQGREPNSALPALSSQQPRSNCPAHSLSKDALPPARCQVLCWLLNMVEVIERNSMSSRGTSRLLLQDRGNRNKLNRHLLTINYVLGTGNKQA